MSVRDRHPNAATACGLVFRSSRSGTVRHFPECVVPLPAPALGGISNKSWVWDDIKITINCLCSLSAIPVRVCRVHYPPGALGSQLNGKIRPGHGVRKPPLGGNALPSPVKPHVSEMKKRTPGIATLGKNHAGIVVAVSAVNAYCPYATLSRQLGRRCRKGDADLVVPDAGRGRAGLGGRRAVVHGAGIGVASSLIRFDLTLRWCRRVVRIASCKLGRCRPNSRLPSQLVWRPHRRFRYSKPSPALP